MYEECSTSNSQPLKPKKSNDNVTKLQRKHILEQQRRIKPGNCLKYIKVLIDPNFSKEISMLTEKLIEIGIKFESHQYKLPIITWMRSEQQILSQQDLGSIELTEKFVSEKFAIVLIRGKELIQLIEKNALENYIKDVKKELPNIEITFLIYELRKYCKNNPIVKRLDIEIILTELHVIHKCSHRLIEDAEAARQLVGQFSKAIAEIPYKKAQQDKFDNLNLFLLNDNKDCVRVEGTAGLSQLWQQHLTRLPLVTLETAETIMNVYKTPKQLFNEYENCNSQVLCDLKIRRAIGPIQSNNRRIGPELSKKIHMLYTGLDPNEVL